MTVRDEAAIEAGSAAFPSRLPLGTRPAYACAFASGILYWLAFPGKLQVGGWHGLLALVAFLPLWIAMLGQTPKRSLGLGVLAGATMNLAGFTWLLDMLKTFSGFPSSICLFFVFLVCVYQGGRIGMMGWLFGRATARGWPAAPVFVAAFAVSELLYPLLFPWYFAATAYKLPALSQTAELGGPILVGCVLVGMNVALAEPLVARLTGERPRPLVMAVPVAALGLALAFAAVRIPAVDRRAQAAEPVHVGVVQGNLGLIEKREDPAEGLRRHMRLTNDLKAKGVELVVWSESSVTMSFPEGAYPAMMRELFTQSIGVPAIIGTVLYSEGGLQQLLYNTALSVDVRGGITGRYDKEFLLAFGEYLPLGDLIPKLYEWSPNSGHFTPGTLVDPLTVTVAGVTHPVSALICYEDILPSFTDRVVAHAKPDLLVSMSNDAWFGDTSEPWEHLALAQLSAIEHRRYLVRSTNSGVSAVVDPVGRVIVHGGTFDSEALDAIVHWMHDATVYERVGDVPWYALSLTLVALAFVRRGGGRVGRGGRGDSARDLAAVTTALACLAALAGAGCSSSSHAGGGDAAADDAAPDAGHDAGVDTSSPPSFDAGPCPAIATVDFGGLSCDSCVATRCCTATSNCFGSNEGGVSACALLANCLSDCEGAEGDAGDSDAQASCEQGCEADGGYPSGRTAYLAAKACIAHQCTDDAGTAPCN